MRRKRRWKYSNPILLGAISVIISGTGVFRGDIESESVPHSRFPEIESEFTKIRKSYKLKNTDFKSENDQINVAFVSCGGGKSRLNEVKIYFCLSLKLIFYLNNNKIIFLYYIFKSLNNKFKQFVSF